MSPYAGTLHSIDNSAPSNKFFILPILLGHNCTTSQAFSTRLPIIPESSMNSSPNCIVTHFHYHFFLAVFLQQNLHRNLFIQQGASNHSSNLVTIISTPMLNTLKINQPKNVPLSNELQTQTHMHSFEWITHHAKHLVYNSPLLQQGTLSLTLLLSSYYNFLSGYHIDNQCPLH